MANTNCLEGLACPCCAQEDEVLVYARVWVALRDDGTDPFADSLKNRGDTDYDDGSAAECPCCGYIGKMNNFRRAGAIKEQEPDER